MIALVRALIRLDWSAFGRRGRRPPPLPAAGTAPAWPLGRRRGLTVDLTTGNCNKGLVLAALGRDAALEAVAFFAVAQIPMDMLPGMPLAAHRRFAAGA